MIPLQLHRHPSDRPFFVKLLAEADPDLLKTRSGNLYLGFYLDPIYSVYWKNELPKLRFKMDSDPEVLPLSLGWQSVDTTSRQFLWLLGQPSAELDRFFPGHAVNREILGVQATDVVGPDSRRAKVAGLVVHYFEELALGNFEDTHVEWPGDLHFVLWLAVV